MIARLDEALRTRLFQPLADWSTDRFDRSCYWLASRSALAILVAGAPLAGRTMAEAGPWVALIFVAAGGASVDALWRRAVTLERRWRSDPSLPPAAEAPFDRGLRLYWLAVLLLIPALADGLAQGAEDAAFDGAFVSAFYFLACLPRLPRPRPARVPASLAAEGAPS